MKSNLRTSLVSFFCLTTLAASINAYADTIENVKGSRALIISDSSRFYVGQKVFAVDEAGKKRALIVIDKVKGNKAIGDVIKGEASPGMNAIATRTQLKVMEPAEPIQTQATSSTRRKRTYRPNNRDESVFRVGALAGVGYGSLTVKLLDVTSSETQNLTMAGTGFSGRVMADYNFQSYLGLRLMVGLENFVVEQNAASEICDGVSACKTTISYFTLDAWLRYAFIDSKSKVWVGGGGGVWRPISQATNSLDKDSITSAAVFFVGGGVDLDLSETLYLPFQVEYIFLPGSSQVTASLIALRAGLAYRFP